MRCPENEFLFRRSLALLADARKMLLASAALSHPAAIRVRRREATERALQARRALAMLFGCEPDDIPWRVTELPLTDVPLAIHAERKQRASGQLSLDAWACSLSVAAYRPE